jgi:poly(glycerol-phosphate) alpha-glucosyltransferase
MLTAAVSRNGGGVFPASSQLAKALELIDPIKLKIFGIEDEYALADQAAWQGIQVSAERVVGPRHFGYAPSLTDRLLSGGLDLVHAHGIWMYPSIASLRWAHHERRPYIVSPHGMLDSWALAQSRWKKRVAGALFENQHLRGAACLHALTRAEARSIRSYGLKNPVCVIPNGVRIPVTAAIPHPPWEEEAGPETRVLLYLGRLHPKKGLTALLLAWSQFRIEPAARSWRLVIAGGDEGGHGDWLRRLCGALGIEGTVVFAGPQYGTAKAASFARASAFVLPSQSEGLPMAVLEAWASGLPVLMTPECNLPEGFEAGAAMRVAAPRPIEIRNALERLFQTPPARLRAMGARGRELARQNFSWDSAAHEMKLVYEWVLGQGEKPASVTLQ